jgi:hypothetical protein
VAVFGVAFAAADDYLRHLRALAVDGHPNPLPKRICLRFIEVTRPASHAPWAPESGAGQHDSVKV